MRSQKIINLLDNEIAQPSKFRTKNWVQINDDVCGTYSVNSHYIVKIKFMRLQ